MMEQTKIERVVDKESMGGQEMRYGEGVRGIEKEGGDKGVTVVVRERMYMCMDGCVCLQEDLVTFPSTIGNVCLCPII